jgi:hypothetical protein
MEGRVATRAIDRLGRSRQIIARGKSPAVQGHDACSQDHGDDGHRSAERPARIACEQIDVSVQTSKMPRVCSMAPEVNPQPQPQPAGL